MHLNLFGLFLLPLIFSLFFLLSSLLSKQTLKTLAFTLSLLPLVYLFYGGRDWMGADFLQPWFSSASVIFHLQMDALSLLFVALTVLLVPIVVLSINTQIDASYFFYALVFLLEGLLIGFFTAKDLALFTIFWEGMLLPLYFIIALWGESRRQEAALKFLVYMIAGSALMVAAVLSLYLLSASNGAATFNLDQLARVSETVSHSKWLFLIFLLAFAVKTPLFPFHGWLPDAYYQAPLAGTILLSAILSKAGIYGVLRIGIALFPLQMQQWSVVLLALAVVGIFYGGLAAWMENDFKRLIAYSSFSHVNFILLGLFVWNEVAHSGAILQALNHGITIAALFLMVGFLQERLGQTTMGIVGGLARFMPTLCWLTLFFVLSSIALPATNSFVGEFLILYGLFAVHPWLTGFVCLSVVLSAMYLLRLMQKVYFEAPSFYQKEWVDIRRKEFLMAVPLVFLVLWIGVYPAPVLNETMAAAHELNTNRSSQELTQ